MRFWFLLLMFCGFSFQSHSQEPEFAIDVLRDFQNVRDFTISNSGNEAYVTIQSPLGEVSVIAKITKSNGQWSEPTIVNFSGKFNDLEPFLSPDNLRLYFVSNRPLSNLSSETKDYDIWYVERKDITSKWEDPINMGAPINTEHNEFYPSVSKNNNLYFTSDHPDAIGKDDIFVSRWNKNGYSKPENLSESINTKGYEFNAFISPDESYLIFSGYNREDGLGSADLYISYNTKNGWSKAVNLGAEVNSKHMDYCPFVDQNSNTLYFTSKRSDYNKTQEINSLDALNQQLQKTKNGLSKIYSVSFNASQFYKKASSID